MAWATVMFIVISFCGLPLVCMECIPPKGEQKTNTLEWKMMISDVVANGVVTKVESDAEMSKDSYSVDFELRCIYKGGPLDELIKINQVGYNSNNCLTTNLTLGLDYLVYLKKTDSGQYVQEFKQDPADTQYLDEIVVLCDASVSYPNGFDKNNNKGACPEEYMYDDCLPRPVLANPPYSEDEQSSTLPDDNKQTKGEGVHFPGKVGSISDKNEPISVESVPNKSQQSPGGVQQSGDNGSTTLTFNLRALAFLLLVTIFQL